MGKDCQSDKQAAEVMTSHGAAHWDSLGLTIYLFASSLIVGSFTAARLSEPEEIFVNCLSGPLVHCVFVMICYVKLQAANLTHVALYIHSSPPTLPDCRILHLPADSGVRL